MPAGPEQHAANAPATRFVVLATTRSGSTWFLTLLNGQPGVKAVGEIFLWRSVRAERAWLAEGYPERFVTRRESLGRWRIRQTSRYLDELDLFFSGAASGGFKLITAHLRKVPELALLLLLRRYRLIVLVRRDPFKSVVSEMVALATDNPHGTADNDRPIRIELDPTDLVRRVKRRRRVLGTMRAVERLWPWPSTLVDYDAVVTDQEAAMEPVLRTLGLADPPVAVESRLKRRLTAGYHDIIANYDDVTAAMRRAGLDLAEPDR